MIDKTSLADIDLTKQEHSDPFPIDRDWKNEIIYFLMVDRFHDGKVRETINDPAAIRYSQEELMGRHGGTFKGILSQLSYIKDLGCTALWLSPVFENYEKSYHGYAINNFLATDPQFGTIDELRILVDAAHALGIRVILDIVINHTADTWHYAKKDCFYTGASYRFGDWKDTRYPIPTELRNPDYYKKAGAIRNWDAYPETQEGDIFELKKLITDESPVGQEVLAILIKIYRYWIRETNVDGFRLDTVKHLSTSAVATFCHKIREYASYLGKPSFMIFGEAIGDYTLMGNYFRPVKTKKHYSESLDAALDFPLHFILEDLVKGKKPASELYKLYRKSANVLARTNRKRKDLIVFADNHDQIGQEHKARMAFEAEEKQVIAMVGLTYFLYGIPCLYYGTEQFMRGNGPHDCWLREPMFLKDNEYCLQNTESFLYKEISFLGALRKSMSVFLEASPDFDFISINGGDFISCEYVNEFIYWSKRVFEDKMILLFNPKKEEKLSICAKLSPNGLRIKSKFEYVYGASGETYVDLKDGCGYINIDLYPLQFVILK